jgi:zinc protease
MNLMKRKNTRIPVIVMVILVLAFLLVVDQPELLAMPRVERIVLPNQLVLLIREDHSLPLVTMRLLVDAGSRRDPRGKEGLADITAEALLLGTSKYPAPVFDEALDFMGASLHASTGRDAVAFELRILKKHWLKGFDLLMEALIHPTFSEEEIRRQVQKTLAAIQSQEENPGHIARKAFMEVVFLGNPYGHPVEGKKESLPDLTRETVVQFHHDFYHPNNAILTIVGDVTKKDIKTNLIPRLSEWSMTHVPEQEFIPRFTRWPMTLTIDRNVAQANIILGHMGIDRANTDYYPLTVMNHILGGGGFGSRLMEEIRVKRGLAYSVVSYFDAGKYPGAFQVILQTKNASAQEAISILREQLKAIQENPVSVQELERAKKYLVGSFPFRLDTQLKLARFLTEVEYHGLGLDYPEKYASSINAVTRKDVLRVAQKYLFPENAALVVVANLKEAGLDESAQYLHFPGPTR